MMNRTVNSIPGASMYCVGLNVGAGDPALRARQLSHISGSLSRSFGTGPCVVFSESSVQPHSSRPSLSNTLTGQKLPSAAEPVRPSGDGEAQGRGGSSETEKFFIAVSALVAAACFIVGLCTLLCWHGFSEELRAASAGHEADFADSAAYAREAPAPQAVPAVLNGQQDTLRLVSGR